MLVTQQRRQNKHKNDENKLNKREWDNEAEYDRKNQTTFPTCSRYVLTYTAFLIILI